MLYPIYIYPPPRETFSEAASTEEKRPPGVPDVLKIASNQVASRACTIWMMMSDNHYQRRIIIIMSHGNHTNWHIFNIIVVDYVGLSILSGAQDVL